MKTESIPKAFVWRRLHSLTGVFLSLFLIEHLFINSQSALFFGGDGLGFIHSVNSLHDLPYLVVIESLLLGAPIALHAIYGIHIIRTGKMNSGASDGTTPSLGMYPRNKAYSWQRITSWILLVGIVAHVVHMRIVEYPEAEKWEQETFYKVRLQADPGLIRLAERLHVQLEESGGQVIAFARDFGTAELLVVRETFKMPFMMTLYTIFVLAACYHGFNGFFTFLITWGITLSERSQKLFLKVSYALMGIVSFLGLASIFGTYWINLKS